MSTGPARVVQYVMVHLAAYAVPLIEKCPHGDGQSGKMKLAIYLIGAMLEHASSLLCFMEHVVRSELRFPFMFNVKSVVKRLNDFG